MKTQRVALYARVSNTVPTVRHALRFKFAPDAALFAVIGNEYDQAFRRFGSSLVRRFGL